MAILLCYFKKDTGPSKNILSLYQSSPLPLFQLHVQCTSTQRESGDPLKPKSTLKLLGLDFLRTGMKMSGNCALDVVQALLTPL